MDASARKVEQTSPVRIERHRGTAVIWTDNPPVNALGQAVRAGLASALDVLDGDPAVDAVVIACAGKTFFAGADITEFDKPPMAPTLHEVLDRLDAMRKPVVAAIHGTALGGGFEVALACDRRIALVSAKLGLPEIKLGLLPGAGGTQRLPRAVGFAQARALIHSGTPVVAPTAFAMGALDAVVQDDLVGAAIKLASSLAGAPRTRLRDRSVDPGSVETREDPPGRQAAIPARQAIDEALQAALDMPFDDGLRRERALFAECRASLESRALRHLFFAERLAGKEPNGLSGTPRPIGRAAVIGAGTMGSGIAALLVAAGIPTTLVDEKPEALERGRLAVARIQDAAVKKGRITRDAADAILTNLAHATDIEAVAEADIAIEAVFETIDVKCTVLRRLDSILKEGAIIASNTSYIPIIRLGTATRRSADVIGLHFFSPAHAMRLVEVVPSAETGADCIATALALCRRIRKVAVITGDRRGFIVNNLGEAYTREANLLMLEGVGPEDVDRALMAFGFAMGPFQVRDLSGLDIGYRARREAPAGNVDPIAFQLADRLVEVGRLGQKTGGGWYDYGQDGRTPTQSPTVAKLAAEIAEGLGIQRRAISDEEIVERCILALVSQGFKALADGAAIRASDIDVALVNGYGFPAHCGGPMFWAENAVGLCAVKKAIERYRAIYGERRWPDLPLLDDALSRSQITAELSTG